MGGMFTALRGYMADFVKSQFWGVDGRERQPDLRQGGGENEEEDKWVPDHGRAIGSVEVVPDEFPSCELGAPELLNVSYLISPVTRQRSVQIEVAYPGLNTDKIPVRATGFVDVWGRRHAPPSIDIITQEDHQQIIFHATPFHPITFKVAKVEIVRIEQFWDRLRKRFKVQVIFKRPRPIDAAKEKLNSDSPGLYHEPPA